MATSPRAKIQCEAMVERGATPAAVCLLERGTGCRDYPDRPSKGPRIGFEPIPMAFAVVTGGGVITLAATLSTTHTIPVAGLALLLGIDRFMSEARAITNLIGNGVATVVIARWEGGLDVEQVKRVLDGETDLEADTPERVVDDQTAKKDISITGE